MSIKKECVIVAGNQKCHRCLKGKKGCKFTVAEKEEEEEEGEGDDVEEEELQKSWLPVAALKKILSLPIHSLCKRKEIDLSLGSVKERAETLSIANHARLESEAPELEVMITTRCHLYPLFRHRYLVVLCLLLIFSILPRTSLFATSSWPYVHCRRISLTFKSSLHQGNHCIWRRSLS